MKNKPSLKKALLIAKPYFLNSNERVKAWLLFIGTILAIIAVIALTALVSWYSVGIWSALIAKDVTLFIQTLAMFGVSLMGLVSSLVIKDYLKNILDLNWRKWLTKDYIRRYVTEKKYLHMPRLKKPLDNPAQRIQEEVKDFVDLSLSLMFDFVNAALRIAIFSTTLWIVGGALTLAIFGASITIPGYLFWCALLFSFVGNYISHKIGHALTQLNTKEKQYKTELRQELEFIQQESENIAQARGEKWHEKMLEKKSDALFSNRAQKIKKQAQLSVFLNFYLNSALVFPLLSSAPLLFSDAISITQLGQISTAFSEIQLGFSWFSTSYDTLTTYLASVERLDALEKTFKKIDSHATHKHIKTHTLSSSDESIRLEKITAATPENPTSHIFQNLNLELKPHQHTLFKGESGLGKSTFFKILAGTWKHGSGELSVPHNKHTFFLTQKPLIPNGDLKTILAYPESSSSYAEEDYKTALKLMGLEKLIPLLHTTAAWSQRLSGGEQQRISFARALLKKPRWLFMDESTSALDPKNERRLYQVLKTELKDTTMVSIAHTSSVDQYHDNVLTLEKDNIGHAHLRETKLAANEPERLTTTRQIMS